MFNIAAKPTFTRNVPVLVPSDAPTGFDEQSLKVTFRVVPKDEAEKYDTNTLQGSNEFLRAAIVKIDDLVDGDNKPVTYTETIRDQLLAQSYITVGLVRSYTENTTKAKSGN